MCVSWSLKRGARCVLGVLNSFHGASAGFFLGKGCIFARTWPCVTLRKVQSTWFWSVAQETASREMVRTIATTKAIREGSHTRSVIQLDILHSRTNTQIVPRYMTASWQLFFHHTQRVFALLLPIGAKCSPCPHHPCRWQLCVCASGAAPSRRFPAFAHSLQALS